MLATARKIARPPKTLIRLIQSELQQGNDAARAYYRRAGEMLIEAKDQVLYGSWGRWLAVNLYLSDREARNYIQWACHFGNPNTEVPASLSEMTGKTERRSQLRQAHRELALELVDLGFHALATRLHPDRGGSHDAMVRLNRVREELKRVAQTRRFVSRW